MFGQNCDEAKLWARMTGHSCESDGGAAMLIKMVGEKMSQHGVTFVCSQ